MSLMDKFVMFYSNTAHVDECPKQRHVIGWSKEKPGSLLYMDHKILTLDCPLLLTGSDLIAQVDLF